MPIVHYNTRSSVDKLADKLTLSDEQFEQIAKETEVKAAHDYPSYKRQLITFASLGYLYIGVIVALLLSLVFVVCWLSLAGHRIYVGAIKIVLVLLILVFLVLKSLWVKFDPPAGILLERSEYPELFSLLDEICTKLDTRADKVVLNSEFNAAVVEHPKFGFLGFNTNYLILGLPFLQAVNKHDLKAVLAHEFGHLSGKHSNTSKWIYGLFKQWANLFQNIGEKSFLIYPFFSWYMPRYLAYSMIMIRNHEKHADADAVKIAGADACGNMLVLVALKGRHLSEEIWTEIYKKAKSMEEAPRNAYHEIGERINTLPNRKLRQWLEEELKYEGSKTETHPPTRERLALCNQLERFERITDEELEKLVAPISPGESAAEVLLGTKLPELVSKLSAEWHSQTSELWTERNKQYQLMREELKKIEDKEEKEPLTIYELKQKAYLVEEVLEYKDAVPIYRQILERNPTDAIANFNLGAYISRTHKQDNLNGDDALHHLEQSFKTDLRFAEVAKQLASSYLRQEKRLAEIERFEKYDPQIKEALAERGTLKDTDEFLSEDLDKEELEAIVEMCQSIESITEMTLVKKKVLNFPASRHFVLGANVRAVGDKDEFRQSMANVIMQYFDQLPGTRSVVVFDMWTKKLEQKMKEVPGSIIFKR